MIQSFADKKTKAFFEEGTCPAQWRPFSNVAKRKLDYLLLATDIRDLRNPPGNRLEKLRGDLEGFHSIRINDQWRVIFRWEDDGAHDVEIIDYHD